MRGTISICRRHALWAALSLGAITTFACTAQAAPTNGQPTGSDSADARGRALLTAQLAALADNTAFAGTFASKATVLTPTGSGEVHESDAQAAWGVAGMNPHAQIKSATFDHFTSGSAGNVAWFAADLHITVVSHEPQSPPATNNNTIRAIELLDGAAGWKVTVAAFTRVGNLHKVATSTINDRSDAGPLTNLLTSPTAIADALGDNAVVYGTDAGERGLGTKDAKTLLGRWSKLTITLDSPPAVHEVHGTTYGYTMANINLVTRPGGPAYSLNAFLLALPTAGGKWSVIGVSYSAL
jgi:hypothetical protein